MKVIINFNKFIIYLVYILLILPFLSVPILSNLDNILNIWKIVSTIVILIIMLINYKNIKLDKGSIIIIVFFMCQILVSIIQSNLTIGIAFSSFFLMVSSIFLKSQILNNKYEFIYALCYIHVILIIINLPSLFQQLQFSKYDRIFFLGGKNSLSIISISTIFYLFIKNYLQKKRISIFDGLIIFVSLFTPLIGGSSTGFLVSIFLIVLIIFYKKLNYNILYILYFFISYILVFNTNILLNFPIISNTITLFFEKSLTFTGRTIIWQKSIQLIKLNPIGIGRGSFILGTYFHGINECHNILLQIIFDGGWISLIIFCYFIFSSLNIIKNNSKISSITKGTLLVLLILGMSESINYKPDLWFVLIILNTIKHIELSKCGDVYAKK